jgi:hypothetical protein
MRWVARHLGVADRFRVCASVITSSRAGVGRVLAVAALVLASCSGGKGPGGNGGTAGAAGGGGPGGADAAAGRGGAAGTVSGPGPRAADAQPAGADVAAVPAGLAVVGVQPAPRSLRAPLDGTIVVRFDRAVARESVTPRTFWAYGRWSGPLDGTLSFAEDDRTVSLKPRRSFSAGDRVTVILASSLRAVDGSSLRRQGHAFQFWTAVKPAPLQFPRTQTVPVRGTDGRATRAYGGTATDLDGDGYLDMMIVNEDSADLRIFMNDRTGRFRPFVQPTTPLDERASPSEASDFNRDGIVDLVTANLNADNLSVLIGKGDGTFLPGKKYPTKTGSGSAQPRGVAVLDIDGDGDVDLVNTNNNSSTMAMFVNDGAGNFGLPMIFDAGHRTGTRVDGEFGLFDADLNEDGIIDLVIGGKRAGGTVVNLGTGAGGFTFGGAYGPATTPWQIAVGDLNGDGHEDVVTSDADLDADESKDTATVLLGDGKGGLRVVQSHRALGAPFAVDVGDLDGDGDLDMIVSNYRGGAWQLFENTGAGDQIFRELATEQHMAADAASCAILADVDNDGDLDIIEIDENRDEFHVRTH